MSSLKRLKTHYRAFTKQGLTRLKPATIIELKWLLNMPVVPCSCVRRLLLSRENGGTLRELSAYMKILSSKLHLQHLYSDKQACILLLQNHVQWYIMKYPNLLGGSSLEELEKGYARRNLPFSDRFYKRSVIWEDLRNEAISSPCWNNPWETCSNRSIIKSSRQ